MKSTGEVMGIDRGVSKPPSPSPSWAAARKVPTVRDGVRLGPRFRQTTDSGGPAGRWWAWVSRIIATSGTANAIWTAHGRAGSTNGSTRCLEGRPHIVDAIKNGDVQLVFNTTEGAQALADSTSLADRQPCLHKVPYYTTLAGAIAAAQGIRAYRAGDMEVRALQDYFAA